MKAVIVHKPNNAAFVETSIPIVGPNELLVKVQAVGICMSDVEIMDGTRPEPYIKYPIIPGHEWCGSVAKIGDLVEGFIVGDRVAVEGQNYCKSCFWCTRGETNLCAHYNEFGFTISGGYAEYVAVRSDLAHKFRETLSFQEAALTEPAACAGNAVLRADIHPGETVAIVGPGTIGLLEIAWAKQFEPKNIVAIGVDKTNEALAFQVGATHFVTVDEDPISFLHGLTEGRGADVVLEAAGDKTAIHLSLNLSRRGGTVVFAGIIGGDSTIAIDANVFALKDLRIHGIFAYSTSVFVKTLRQIESGSLQIKPLITHIFPLSSYDQAFDLLKTRKEPIVKILLKP